MSQRQRGKIVTGWQAAPAPGPKVMDGRYVRLERLDAQAHGADLAQAWLGHDWLWDYMGYGPFADEAEVVGHLERIADKADPYFYAIRDKASGRALGVAAYLRIEPAMGVIEVGHICLAPALQQTPAATEAMVLMMGWAFTVGYRRHEWKCDALNLPSRRAAIRLGLNHEGVFRQHMVIKGRNRDTAWFAVTDGDWPALQAAYARWLAPENFMPDGGQITALSDLTRPLLITRDPALAVPA